MDDVGAHAVTIAVRVVEGECADCASEVLTTQTFVLNVYESIDTDCDSKSGREVGRELTHTSTYKAMSDGISKHANTWIREHYVVRFACDSCEKTFEKEVALSKQGVA